MPNMSDAQVNFGGTFDFVKKWKWLIVIVAVLAFVVGPTIGWGNAVYNDGMSRQNQVAMTYRTAVKDLSTCLDQSTQALGIAQAERKSLNDILVGVATARNTTKQQAAGSAIVINAVHEAVPTVSDKLFGQLMDVAMQCRSKFSGAQDKVQYYGTELQTWTQTGGIMEKFIRGRFPNEDLSVTGPDGKPVTGAAALKFILDPIITQEADDASRTKRLPNQQLGQTTPASPAPSRS